MLGLAEGLRKAAPATCTAREGRGGWAGAASSRTCIAHGRHQQQNGGVGGLLGEQVSPTVTGTGPGHALGVAQRTLGIRMRPSLLSPSPGALLAPQRNRGPSGTPGAPAQTAEVHPTTTERVRPPGSRK